MRLENELIQHIEAVRNALSVGDLIQAAEHLRAIIELYPENGEILSLY